jgi:glycosyltransferase involved in cell wall biosynthesis
VHLAERLEAEGIRHVHAQFATHPATVALVIAELTDLTFSITAHAHDLFVHQALLPVKLERAAFVRVISRFNRDWLLSRFDSASAARLPVIHVGIDAEAYAGGRRFADTIDTDPTAADEPLIVSVASLQSYKGLDVLIDGCAALAARGIRFRCHIVGDGPERPRLERLIEQRGLGAIVTLRGVATADDVRAELDRATVFVLPSVVAANGQMEGIPVALMEAMAAGLPVVASDLSGIPELVVHDETGILTQPGSASDIAGAIARLLTEPAERKRLGQQARRIVRQSFALEPTVAALIDEIDAHNPPPSPRVEALIRDSTWPGFSHDAIGVVRVHRGTDSEVIDLIATRTDGPLRVVLKVQRTRPGESRPAGDRARHEFDVLSRLRAGGQGRWPLCRVPRPLHIDEEAASLVMEACAGQRLDRLIRSARGASDPRRVAGLLEAVRGAGVWLRIFQDQTGGQGRAAGALAALNARIADDIAACLMSGALGPAEADAVESRLRDIAIRVESHDPPATGHHGDFQPGNLFVGDESVEAIDFEGYRPGFAAEDAGDFLAHLALYFALFRGRGQRAAAAFLEGYGPRQEDEAGLRLCTAATALRLLRAEAGTDASRASRFLLERARRRVLRDLIVRG